MSNAPKTGFFQTIPGLITATAGFLSAATGAIVALNQTGVIDLKKTTATNPTTQSAPLVTPNVVSPAAEVPRGSELSAGGTSATKPTEPIKQPESVPAVSTLTTEKAAPASQPVPRPADTKSPEEVQTHPSVADKSPDAPSSTIAEVKPETSAPSKSSVRSDEEKLRAIREGAAASAQKQDEKPAATTVPTTMPKRETSPPASAPTEDRVADSKPLPAKPVPAPPAREVEKPSIATDTRSVETVPHVVKPPPSPTATDKSRRPDPGDRVADARRDDRIPERADEDGRGPKIVRPPSDVGGRESGKRVVTDPEPGGRKVIETGRAHSLGERTARELDLAGLKLAIPSGWTREEVTPGPLAPVAVLRIHDPSGDGTVQVTRYLGAKGPELEERSIERWVGQVTKANGQPSSRADAKVERMQLGPVRITTVDLAGTVKTSPRDTGEPGQRMFSAIIDHPAGPHLVTIVGPARAMSKWDAAIDGFLRSAKPE